MSIVETVEELLGEGKKKETKTETVVLLPIRETDRPLTEVSSRETKKDTLADLPTRTNI